MENTELIKRCDDWISSLCQTGGRSWSLQIPINSDIDPDELFSELIDRFKNALQELRNANTSTNKHYTKCVNEIYADKRTEDYSREEVLDIIKRHFA